MARSRPKPLVLMILDGYGFSPSEEGNAVRAAKQPNMERYLAHYPWAALTAGGLAAGLPWGEMGNSETGHGTIGAGRVVYQPLPRINRALEDGSFGVNKALLSAIAHIKEHPDAALHTMGLLSNGGVHSHLDHQLALLDMAVKAGVGERTYVHAFLDGRDAAPDHTSNFVRQLLKKLVAIKGGALVSMIGRYYAMDRNQNWDRIQRAYDLLVRGRGEAHPTAAAALAAAYGGDPRHYETAPPLKIDSPTNSFRPIRDGDAVIFYNYRPDRAVQLARAFVDQRFREFPVERWRKLQFVTFASYADSLPCPVAFPAQLPTMTLGEVVSRHRLTQLRIAESEKFAHVTYFLNGGVDRIFPGEERVQIPSRNVKDYSTTPGMSAAAVSDAVLAAMRRGVADIVVVNYANPDMVGHTANFQATVKALELLDSEIGRVVDATLKAGGAIIITGDHGKAEQVVNPLTAERSTDHTSNPVPLVYLTASNARSQPRPPEEIFTRQTQPIGVLADVAPTVLDILGVAKPAAMTGQSLLSSLR